MKIGILTHHYINNFGAFLQAYALQCAVSELFPEDDVKIIDYVNRQHAVINTLGWFRFYRDKENFKLWLQKTKLPKTFEKARQKYMKLTERVYTVEDVNRLKLDAIIIGSDEVWNYVDKKSFDTIKFGVGLTCKNIISYAPSVGQAADFPVPESVKAFPRRFSSISARDEATRRLVASLGGVADRVPDPTFLTPVPTEAVKVRKPYILFYYCQNLPKKIVNEIKRFADENGLVLYGAGECDKDYAAETVNLTPFQWAGMFRNAEYVFTGTFHGVIFAMLNKRQFVCYLTNPSRVAKVGSLLNDYNLQNRNFTLDGGTDIITQLRSPIDYDAVFETIQKNAEVGREFLRKSLGGTHE